MSEDPARSFGGAQQWVDLSVSSCYQDWDKLCCAMAVGQGWGRGQGDSKGTTKGTVECSSCWADLPGEGGSVCCPRSLVGAQAGTGVGAGTGVETGPEDQGGMDMGGAEAGWWGAGSVGQKIRLGLQPGDSFPGLPPAPP